MKRKLRKSEKKRWVTYFYALHVHSILVEDVRFIGCLAIILYGN